MRNPRLKPWGFRHYRVTVGTDVQDVTSTAEHTLYFTTTQSGALHVSVTLPGAPPLAVTDLRVTDAVTGTGVVTVTLGWTPSADAVTTTLRYSDAPITAANWDSATLLTDSLSGSANTHAATIPYIGGTLYLALKTQNARGAWSALSNNTLWPRRDVYLPLVMKQ